MKRIMAVLLLGAASLSAQRFTQGPVGQPSTTQDPTLKKVGFDQRLNQQLPVGLAFQDEAGNSVRIADYLKGKPLIVAPVYYECPMLCSQILNGLVTSLRAVKFDASRDFDVVAVSFDPAEKPGQAAKAKEKYMGRYRRPGTENGWHFLTGDEASIKTLTEAMGFRYVWDERSKQFAHASGVLVVTPEGRISRYLYGVEYAPRDLRLGLVEASANKIGSPVDQLLLFCFHYDPLTGKYSAIAINILRLLGAVTVLALGSFIFIMLRRDRLAQRTA